MNLGDLDLKKMAENGATLTLQDPSLGGDLINNDGTPMTVTVKGSDSPTYKRAVAMMVKKNKSKDGDLEAVEANFARAVAKAVTEVNIEGADGEKIENTPAAIQLMFSQHLWIPEQVVEFLRERSNFLVKPSQG